MFGTARMSKDPFAIRDLVMAWTGLYTRLRQKRSRPFGPVLLERAYPFLKPHPNQLAWRVRPDPTPGWFLALHDYAGCQFLSRHFWKFCNPVFVRFRINFLFLFRKILSAPIEERASSPWNGEMVLGICDFETELVNCFRRLDLSLRLCSRTLYQ